MAYRLSKIYTRSGDKGTTALSDGSRVAKHSKRTNAIGDVDELNAFIGLLRAAFKENDPLQELLGSIQHRLFNVGAMLATPGGKPLIQAAHTTELEQILDKMNASLPPLTEFILPAGSEAVARAHVARTVCRRAERTVTLLAASEPVDAELCHYMNRLSDLLFVLSRNIATRADEHEVLWQKSYSQK